MNDTATAIFAASLDATLYDDRASGDLTREILLRAHHVRGAGYAPLVAASGGLVYSPAHLARLRAEYQRKGEDHA